MGQAFGRPIREWMQSGEGGYDQAPGKPTQRKRLHQMRSSDAQSSMIEGGGGSEPALLDLFSRSEYCSEITRFRSVGEGDVQ